MGEMGWWTRRPIFQNCHCNIACYFVCFAGEKDGERLSLILFPKADEGIVYCTVDPSLF